MQSRASNVEFRCHASLAEISETEWNALLPKEHLPYLRWSFLRTLETTGCVTAAAGWVSCHLSLRRDGQLLAIAPAYLKTNSEGEFVFDQSWAEFAYSRLGIEYYPKLVIACPFTPVTGPRILIRAGEDEPKTLQLFGRLLQQFADETGVSSVHILFPRAEQAAPLLASGLEERHGIQYHWRNAGYVTFEDFLGRYRSKHRTQIRRERKELHAQGLELDVCTGSDLVPSVVDALYEFYIATVDKHVWGRRYLTRGFFEEICANQGQDVLAVLARDRQSRRYVAGSFNLLGSQRLFGRYWGSNVELPFLHFNVCYYAGIEECIRRGIEVFEPGAGGEHKVARGFEPTRTFSLHYLRDGRLRGAVARFLKEEREAVKNQLLAEPGPLRPLPVLG